MELKNAIRSFVDDDEDRAVSPVIGVILMVAITVILAAVIGTFVLGLGDRVSQASPNANFDFSYSGTAGNAETVEITHDGGDGVENDQVKVLIGGQEAWNADDSFKSNFQAGDENPWTTKITAGDTLEIREDGDSINNGDAVKVVWTASGSDKTAVIGESEVNV
jgi:flagellin-like protein